jgi:hypothetical protein
MANRLRQVRILNRSLSPAAAEILVLPESESVNAGTEVRGRLAGPTCPYSATIEVAYPLRPLAQPSPDEPLARRAIIPEPSFWDPVSPFLYHAIIELWQDGTCCDRKTVTHGLRAVRIQAEGLLWNGKRLKLHMLRSADLTEGDLPGLRRIGINGLLLSRPWQTLHAVADRLGFATLVELDRLPDAAEPALEGAGFVGWVLPADWRRSETAWLDWLAGQKAPCGAVADGRPLPSGIQFRIGQADMPAGLPRLVWSGDGELGRLDLSIATCTAGIADR